MKNASISHMITLEMQKHVLLKIAIVINFTNREQKKLYQKNKFLSRIFLWKSAIIIIYRITFFWIPYIEMVKNWLSVRHLNYFPVFLRQKSDVNKKNYTLVLILPLIFPQVLTSLSISSKKNSSYLAGLVNPCSTLQLDAEEFWNFLSVFFFLFFDFLVLITSLTLKNFSTGGLTFLVVWV